MIEKHLRERLMCMRLVMLKIKVKSWAAPVMNPCLKSLAGKAEHIKWFF